jgi:alkylation response protein AidB-like acyl-CoA dehydrogenase
VGQKVIMDLLPPWATDARLALQAEARAFAHDVVLPTADELDPAKGEMPPELVQQMADKGWFGITIPAASGGLGLGVFEY